MFDYAPIAECFKREFVKKIEGGLCTKYIFSFLSLIF